jgi:anthranilate 1,2-dioxygenase small subunit
MYPGYDMAPPDPRTTRELRLEIEEFHAAYCWTLDCGDVEHWPEYFTDDAVYRITARENADAGLPVGLVYADSKAMIRDRAFALKETTMFAPRYLRHLIGNLAVLGEDERGHIKATANYVLLQVLFDRPDAKLHQVGVYRDVFRRDGGELKLAERRCIYDSLLVDNAMCLPV